MVDQSVNGRLLPICLMTNYPLILLQEEGISLPSEGHQLPNTSGFPTKNAHECFLKTRPFTQHLMSSETHLMLKYSTRHISTLQKTQTSHKICDLQMQPHLLLSHMFFQVKFLTLIIFRGTMPFPESWQIHFPHCLCHLGLFTHVIFPCIYFFIHVFIPHLVPKWISEGL